jgi:chromatin remodeling complex protein RSC6
VRIKHPIGKKLESAGKSGTTPIEKSEFSLESRCFSSSMKAAGNKLLLSDEPTSVQRNSIMATAKKTPATKAAPAKKVAAKAPAKKAAPAKKRTPNPAFMKALTPSAALAAVVGATPLPRTEVVSKMWVYIKKHNLQDSVNRRAINADDKLKAVFGKAQVTMFEMAGLIGKHLK